MRIAARRWLREPLLHFGLAATVVFAVDGWPRRNDVDETRIRISAEHVRWLAEATARQTGAYPDQTALEGEVNALVEEEIWVREAARLRLLDGDPIVRRRIAQKMRFLAEDDVAQPTEPEMSEWVKTHSESYLVPRAVRVSQIWLDPERRTPGDLQRTRAALLRDPEALVGHALGLGRDLGFMEVSDLERLFGKAGASRLWTAEEGVWVGPLESRFGTHLARVDAIRAERVPELAQIRSRVAGDLLRARRVAAVEAEMSRLKSGYDIEIEWPEPKLERVAKR